MKISPSLPGSIIEFLPVWALKRFYSHGMVLLAVVMVGYPAFDVAGRSNHDVLDRFVHGCAPFGSALAIMILA